MLQALTTREALRICKANTNRPDLFINENGAWYLRDKKNTQGNTFNSQSIEGCISTEDTLRTKSCSDLLFHEDGGVSLDEFEIIDTPEHKSSMCILS